MTYNFHNLAIKCDTWQQMQQLKEIAERQGSKTQGFAYSKRRFYEGCRYFVVLDYFHFCFSSKSSKETEISFTTFITSHPDYRADGC
jgi:hypothetical protein